jgi:cytochrome oxidase Cu insertion factor (SCO1/SenC/PrrC family)
VLRRIDRRIGADAKLAERVRLYTVSFDPARDAPERMRELRDALEPRSRWAFLTAASPEAIAPVLADYGQDVAPWRDADGHEDGRLVHVLKVFLVDAQGDVRNVYSAGYLDERLVLADLETLLGGP